MRPPCGPCFLPRTGATRPAGRSVRWKTTAATVRRSISPWSSSSQTPSGSAMPLLSLRLTLLDVAREDVDARGSSLGGAAMSSSRDTRDRSVGRSRADLDLARLPRAADRRSPRPPGCGHIGRAGVELLVDRVRSPGGTPGAAPASARPYPLRPIRVTSGSSPRPTSSSSSRSSTPARSTRSTGSFSGR